MKPAIAAILVSLVVISTMTDRIEAGLTARDTSGVSLRCTPGEVFMHRCNTCRCSSAGQAVCTRRACPMFCVENGRVYQLGQQFSPRDCITCTCSPVTGRITCTDSQCTQQWPTQRGH